MWKRIRRDLGKTGESLLDTRKSGDKREREQNGAQRDLYEDHRKG